MNIQISRKNKNILKSSRSNPLMAGFALPAIDKFIQILMNNHFTVILIEQVTEPPEPERKITNIFSPGTQINYCPSEETSNLISVYIDTVKDLKSFAIPQNSKVSLAVEANKEVSLSLVSEGTELPVNSQFKTGHEYVLEAAKTAEYQLKIVDADNHETISDRIKISVVRDMPPHIEVVKPAKDLQKTKFDIVTLEVSALDDYGLSQVDLYIDYSFGSSEKNSVFKAQPNVSSKEENLFYDLDLKKLGLTEGDVITYYLEAKDNAEPTAQVSRTKIFFLEIRPDKNDVEEKEDEEQQGDEQELS